MNGIAYVRMLRPHQWLKNLMLFFPPFLGGVLFSAALIPQLLLPFVAFCSASSATYILNDICDIEYDRHHPDKRTRPLASGQISTIFCGYVCCFFTALQWCDCVEHLRDFYTAAFGLCHSVNNI